MDLKTAIENFPGFKFSPNEQELMYYLRTKIEGVQTTIEHINVIDITQFDPWELPAQSAVPSKDEWFFFSLRARRYPRGLPSKRATNSGYWKATGRERKVKSGRHVIGSKRTLVFYTGHHPNEVKTEWIMHEFFLEGSCRESWAAYRIRKNFNPNSDSCMPAEDLNLSLPGQSSTLVDDHQQQTDEHTAAHVEDMNMVQRLTEGCYNNPHAVHEDNCAFQADQQPTLTGADQSSFGI